tara:strand:- start:43 stop:420 length:378 start_codon:yes stop_codon:yes gene_type:complete
MSIRKRSKTTTVLEIVTAIELPSLDEFCNLFLEDKCKISKCNETLFNSNKKYIYDTTIALLMNNEARVRAIGYDIITTRAQGRELMVHVHDAYKVLYDTIDEKHHTLLPFLNVNRIWDGIGTWQM